MLKLSDYKKCLIELKKELIDLEGPNLKSIILRGSLAKGTVVPGWSDIDLTIILSKFDKKMITVIKNISEEYKIRIGIDTALYKNSSKIKKGFISSKGSVLLLELPLFSRTIYGKNPSSKIKNIDKYQDEIKRDCIVQLKVYKKYYLKCLKAIKKGDKTKFYFGRMLKLAFNSVKRALNYYLIVPKKYTDTIKLGKKHFPWIDFELLHHLNKLRFKWEQNFSRKFILKKAREIGDFIYFFQNEFLSEVKVIKKIYKFFEKEDIKNKKILFLSEDNTRDVKIYKFFPKLYRMLSKKNKIKILFALGTHRKMASKEAYEKLGLKIKYENHDWKDKNKLIRIGKYKGCDILINKLVKWSDLIIGISNTVPHRVAGFSGGAKLICPGIAGKEIIGYSHFISAKVRNSNVNGYLKNPFRTLINHIIGLIPQKIYLINFVLENSKLAYVYLGDIIKAHKKASSKSEKLHIMNLKQQNKVLAIVSDIVPDLWQATKTIYNSSQIVKNGGILVVKANCKEGISNHKELTKYGYIHPNRVFEMVKNGKIKDMCLAAHLIHVGKIKNRINIYLCSPNISKKQCKKLKLNYISEKNVKNMRFDYIIKNPAHILYRSRKKELKAGLVKG